MKIKKNKQDATNEQIKSTINYASRMFITEDHIVRRKQEIKRRFSVLQSRRINLERELKAVKLCMISLDRQLQNYSKY